MKKSILIILVSITTIVLLLVSGFFLNFQDNKTLDKFYSFPIYVQEKTYTIGVLSNYSSAPEVHYFGLLNSISVDFKGDRQNSFCNITIPNDLIWGEFLIIDKYYEMNESDYFISDNSTHNSIYFTFNHTALVKHFEIKGTNGVLS